MRPRSVGRCLILVCIARISGAALSISRVRRPVAHAYIKNPPALHRHKYLMPTLSLPSQAQVTLYHMKRKPKEFTPALRKKGLQQCSKECEERQDRQETAGRATEGSMYLCNCQLRMIGTKGQGQQNAELHAYFKEGQKSHKGKKTRKPETRKPATRRIHPPQTH